MAVSRKTKKRVGAGAGVAGAVGLAVFKRKALRGFAGRKLGVGDAPGIIKRLKVKGRASKSASRAKSVVARAKSFFRRRPKTEFRGGPGIF